MERFCIAPDLGVYAEAFSTRHTKTKSEGNFMVRKIRNSRVDFYTARLLFVSLVESNRAKKSNLYDDSVIVFRAKDFAHTFERALEIGKSKETTYKNASGQTVRWALVEIVNIDYVGKIIDGNEVASKLHYRVTKKPIALRKRFRPERSKPDKSF